MPAKPLDVNREEMRMLVREVGPTEAAKRTGVKLNTILAWSARGNWLQPDIAPAMRPIAMNAITKPADALDQVLSELGNRSKIAASTYAARTLEHAASLAESDPDRALAEAPNAKAVTQTAALAGSWETAASGGVTAVQINIG